MNKTPQLLFTTLLLFLIQPSIVLTQTLVWPTSGWIGYRYRNPTTYCGGNCHTGIDIWSNQNGGWNNGVTGSSNPIYPAASGTIIWEDNHGFYISHGNNLYTIYYHIKDRTVGVNSVVDTTTLLGYQDIDVAVHLHLTVATGPSDSNHTDPSPYFGLQLNTTKPNPVGYLSHHVEHNNSVCSGTDITKINWNASGHLICTASNSIRVLPESTINSSHGDVTLNIL